MQFTQISIFDFLETQQTSSLPTALIVKPEEIKFTSVEAYSYIRECDHRLMTAFMCECENGMLYCKDFYSYHFMVKDAKKNRQHFYAEIDRNRNMPFFGQRTDFIPVILEMHRCRKDVDWDYAEKRYSGCEDSHYFKYQSA